MLVLDNYVTIFLKKIPIFYILFYLSFLNIFIGNGQGQLGFTINISNSKATIFLKTKLSNELGSQSLVVLKVQRILKCFNGSLKVRCILVILNCFLDGNVQESLKGV